MRAYLYGFILLEQRESHDSGQTVSLEELNAMGVQYQRLDGSKEENLAAISALCKERKYMTRDDITISPALIPDYEEKIKSFFVEHIHEDEEVRYVLDGSGYYDNPYDEQQTQILARISNNVVKLNETLLEVNQKIEEINEMNSDLVAFSNIWNHYQRNASLYLASTNSIEPSMVTKRQS
ncbi:1,2-dihydroxy-3-keto-5-methylthiopentene dioxygenase [Coemansia sp. RSA 1804]|nr:1,2-dihydroxy-3-keto-5-methylthiopentene dioxygenase [Coemansia sp. RSA 1804]